MGDQGSKFSVSSWEDSVPWLETLLSSLSLYFPAVRVKGGMCLRNDVWHGLRTDMIMRNVKYGEWTKKYIKLKNMRASLQCLFLAPI